MNAFPYTGFFFPFRNLPLEASGPFQGNKRRLLPTLGPMPCNENLVWRCLFAIFYERNLSLISGPTTMERKRPTDRFFIRIHIYR